MAVGLLLAMLAQASVAHAQNAGTMAEARFHEGMAFTKAGDYESARLAFSQALAIRRDADTLWNLAIVEKQLHREVEASRHIREYLRSPQHHATDEAPAKHLLDEMNPRIAHLKIDAPTGATVLVDGETLHQMAPITDVYDVTAGEHVVRASSENAAGESKVTATQGAETPVNVVFAIPPGSGGNVVAPPRTAERSKLFPPPTGAIVLGGVGLVGLGLGIGFGIASSAQHDNAAGLVSQQPCAVPSSAACTNAKDTSSAADSDKTLSIVGYAAGGTLVAAGVVWWIVAPRKETVSVSAWQPWFGPRGAGLGYQRAF